MASKEYWLKKRIEIAEKAVARYKACELTLLERYCIGEGCEWNPLKVWTLKERAKEEQFKRYEEDLRPKGVEITRLGKENEQLHSEIKQLKDRIAELESIEGTRRKR